MKRSGRFGGTRLTGVVLVGVVLMAFCATAGAQTIGAGSCQTSDGSLACVGDPVLVSVGAGSCDGSAGPCSNDQALVTVSDSACDGTGSCVAVPALASVGDGSCDSANTGEGINTVGGCIDDPKLTTVGAGSCSLTTSGLSDLTVVGVCSSDPALTTVADNACSSDQPGGLSGAVCSEDPDLVTVGAGSCAGTELGGNCVSDPDLTTVGDGSCISGPGTSCGDSATLVSVGDDSCVGAFGSCDSGVTSVGSGSCNAPERGACGGAPGSIGPIGNDSCDGFGSCGSGLTSVGDNACNTEGGCNGNHGSVGNNSCDGALICGGSGNIGESSCDYSECSELASVGDGSCNGSALCENIVDGDTPGSVGDYSCNGAEVCDGLSQSVGVCQDNTLPVPQCDPGASPTLRSGAEPPGWNDKQVTVEWHWAAGPDGAALAAASTTNCPASSTSSGEGAIVLTATCADLNGNVGTASYGVNVDTTGPTDAPTVTGTAGNNGWYTSPVSVAWNWSDSLSGLNAAACPQTTGSGSHEGAAVLLSSSCEDNAGAIATDHQAFKIDTIAPSITFRGAHSSYTLLQTVRIRCAATDNAGGSGIATSTCGTPAADAAAWTFGPGSTTLTATATDNAGNEGSSSTTFSVTVTTGPLCTLTARFVHGTPAFKALPPSQRRPVNAQVRAACADLSQITATSTPAQIAAAIAAYDGELQTLANAGWLSGSQMTALTVFAAAL